MSMSVITQRSSSLVSSSALFLFFSVVVSVAVSVAVSGCVPSVSSVGGGASEPDGGFVVVTEGIDATVFEPEPDMEAAPNPCDPNPCPTGVSCVVEGGEATCPSVSCDELVCPNLTVCVPPPEGSDESARCVSVGCEGDEGCPLEQHCDLSDLNELGQGRCVDDLCAPNERRCVEVMSGAEAQVVEGCDPSGRGFEPLYGCELERSACVEGEGEGGVTSAACRCEDVWDCPSHMRCEQGLCAGRAEPPSCLLPPVPFETSLPTLELSWGGTPGQALAQGSPFPESVQVVMTPLVVNLTDDNGDGEIDERDQPDLLFMSFCNSEFTSNGALRAVHGGGPKKGLDLWARLGPYLWREGEPLPDAGSYRCVDATLDSTAALAAANLDDPTLPSDDGRVEILAIHERDGLVVYSNEGELLLEAFVGDMPNIGPNPAISIAQLDGEGMAEAVVANVVFSFERDEEGGLAVSRLWRGAGPLGRNGQGAVSCVADLDGDGRAEVIAGGRVSRLPQPSVLGLKPEDCASEGGPFEPQTEDDVAWCRGELIKVWDASEVNPSINSSEGFCAVADVWGADQSAPPGPANPLDERPEVLVVINGSLLVLNGQTGELITEVAAGGNNDRGGAPNVDDFDGDGFPEVGSAFAYGYVMMDLQPPTPLCPAWPNAIEDGDVEGFEAQPAREPGPEQCERDAECASPEAVCSGGRCVCLHNGWRRATEDDSSKVTGSTLFDFNGDGASEVIYNDECFFRVYDGRDGRTLFKDPSESRTRIEHPIVADVDNDGNAEIIFSTSTESGFCSVRNQPDEQGTPYRERYNAGVEVWGDPQDSWVPARRVWSQHAYHVTHVTERGGVPLNEPQGWRSREGERPYNSYRSQPRAFGIAPDLQVERLRASGGEGCGGGAGLNISAQLLNAGEVRVGEGVRVRFEGEWGAVRLPLHAPQGEPLEVLTSVGLDPEARLPLTVSYDPQLDPSLSAELRVALPERVWAMVDVEEGSEFGRERECREDNNELSAAVELEAGFAELSVELLSLSSRACPELSVSLRVLNEGSLSAELVSLALYAGDPRQGGVRLDTLTLQAPLAAGESQVIEWVSQRFPVGREVSFWVAIDPNNITPECQEDNNLSEAPERLRCVQRDGFVP